MVTDSDVERLRAFLATSLPDLYDAPLVATRRCLYVDTPDGDFWIDRHPQRAGLTWRRVKWAWVQVRAHPGRTDRRCCRRKAEPMVVQISLARCFWNDVGKSHRVIKERFDFHIFMRIF